MRPVDDVRPEPLQSAPVADIDQLVVVHGRIISRNRPGRVGEYPDIEGKEVRVLRRSIIAVVLVLAAVLTGCTNPSGGGSGAPAPSPAAQPGY